MKTLVERSGRMTPDGRTFYAKTIAAIHEIIRTKVEAGWQDAEVVVVMWLAADLLKRFGVDPKYRKNSKPKVGDYWMFAHERGANEGKIWPHPYLVEKVSKGIVYFGDGSESPVKVLTQKGSHWFRISSGEAEGLGG